jgi:hypothetical protein
MCYRYGAFFGCFNMRVCADLQNLSLQESLLWLLHYVQEFCSVNAKALSLSAFALSHLPEFTASKVVVKIPCLVSEDQCSPCCQMGVCSGVVVRAKWNLLLLGALRQIHNTQCKRGFVVPASLNINSNSHREETLKYYAFFTCGKGVQVHKHPVKKAKIFIYKTLVILH